MIQTSTTSGNKQLSEYILQLQRFAGSDKPRTRSYILTVVCKELDVPVSEVKSPCRNANLGDARKIFILCCARLHIYNVKAIGLLLNRDHSTISTAHRTALNLLKTDKKFRTEYERSINALQNDNF